MRFHYVASTKDGRTVQGMLEAAQREAAIAMLTRQELRPVIVKEAEKQKVKNKRFGSKVKTKDMVIFTRQLSTMISAGVPITPALATLQRQTTNNYFKEVIGEILKDVESGISLGDAFAKYPNVFSDVYVSMIRAGEAGGILDQILKRIAAQVEQEASMRKKIKSAMTYPVVILVITIIAFFGIMMFVIPQLGKIIKELGGEDASLPIYTEIMLSISGAMQQGAPLIFIVLFGGGYALRRYIKTPAGKYRFHAFLLRVPVIKSVVIKIAIARFARTFASLMSSGVNVLDALEVTGAAIGNKVIEAELKKAAEVVKNGKQLSEPLSHSAYFPPIVPQMLAIGEETGQIDTILVKVADFYEEEVETTIDALSSLIEPLMIVVLGGMVGLIAVSVMGPIASLSKNVEG